MRRQDMYLEVKDLKKSYGEGGGYVQVLKGITAGVEQGEMCVIQGTSGSGKSKNASNRLCNKVLINLFINGTPPLCHPSGIC